MELTPENPPEIRTMLNVWRRLAVLPGSTVSNVGFKGANFFWDAKVYQQQGSGEHEQTVERTRYRVSDQWPTTVILFH